MTYGDLGEGVGEMGASIAKTMSPEVRGPSRYVGARRARLAWA